MSKLPASIERALVTYGFANRRVEDPDSIERSYNVLVGAIRDELQLARDGEAVKRQPVAISPALLDVQSRAVVVCELLQVLLAALPEDEAGATPVRGVLCHVTELADALSDAAMRLPVDLAAESRQADDEQPVSHT